MRCVELTIDVCHQASREQHRVLNHLAGTCLLPSTPRLAMQHIRPPTDPQVYRHITLLDPFPIQFLGWKTAEDNCSRRIEVTLQEKHGGNKQEEYCTRWRDVGLLWWKENEG